MECLFRGDGSFMRWYIQIATRFIAIIYVIACASTLKRGINSNEGLVAIGVWMAWILMSAIISTLVTSKAVKKKYDVKQCKRAAQLVVIIMGITIIVPGLTLGFGFVLFNWFVILGCYQLLYRDIIRTVNEKMNQ